MLTIQVIYTKLLALSPSPVTKIEQCREKMGTSLVLYGTSIKAAATTDQRIAIHSIYTSLSLSLSLTLSLSLSV
jgi:hypothetical protein